MNEGWICPRCKKVNAPDVKVCDCGDTNKDFLEELIRKLEEEKPISYYVPVPYYVSDWTYRPWPYWYTYYNYRQFNRK